MKRTLLSLLFCLSTIQLCAMESGEMHSTEVTQNDKSNALRIMTSDGKEYIVSPEIRTLSKTLTNVVGDCSGDQAPIKFDEISSDEFEQFLQVAKRRDDTKELSLSVHGNL